jgi:hypothetical protein
LKVIGEATQVLPLMEASKLVPVGELAFTVMEPLATLQEVGLVLLTLEMVNGGRT